MIAPLGTAELATLLARLALPSPATNDAERIERITVMESVKCALAAAQAHETVAFQESQLAEQEAAGVPARDRGKGIAAQIGLARRESPHKGSRLLGLAHVLVKEMPHTLAALGRGETNEWRATLAARETACLSREDRAAVDAELAGRLGTLGDKQVVVEATKIAYRLDPHAVVARIRKAVNERTVSLRPAPDTMSYLTGLLPVKQGVAAYAALKRDADAIVAAGDERSRGQVMADLLVERLTGQATADRVPVEVQLVISDQTLAGDDEQPAHLQGFGPVPAPWARDLVRDSEADLWLRRLYANRGRLVTMESERRIFPEAIRRFLVARDRTCRTPWCGAPIRHTDHVVPAHADGETAADNGQGLCVTCNHAKEALGWRARPGPDGAGDLVTITTPTGHHYESRPPDPVGRPHVVRMEDHFRELIKAWVA